MNDFLEQYIKLPKNQKIAALVLIYAMVAFLFVYLGYLPSTEEITTLEESQGRLTSELEQLNSTAGDLEKFRQEVDTLNESLNKALKELPNNREIDKLLKRVSTIGKKIGLEFLLFQPLPEVVEGFYAQVPVKIEVAGSFHEIAMFFDRIGKLSRIVNITEIQMSGPQERGGKIILKTSGKATTYRFIDPDEAGAASGKPAEKKPDAEAPAAKGGEE